MLVDPATRALFRALSSARDARFFHPVGRGFRARFTAGDGLGDVEILRPGFACDGVVRLSRGLGLPAPLPDALGFALRLPDVYGPGRHQDFLLASSVGPVVRLARDPWAGPYSSLLPYRGGGERFLLRALPLEPGRVRLLAGSRPLAEVELGEPEDVEGLGFDPWNCGGGLVPHGFLNRLRAPAYVGSRAGRR